VNGAASPIQTVVAGTREPLLPLVDVVANDDYRGGRLATEHLLALGHRRVAHIIGEGEVGRLRRAGYEAHLLRGHAPRPPASTSSFI
jgi:DNA-binding LacI/PurR family transcriptional regulator